MTNLATVFLMAAGGELKWAWCPTCGDRQDHMKSENGEWRCTRCGVAHKLGGKDERSKPEREGTGKDV